MFIGVIGPSLLSDKQFSGISHGLPAVALVFDGDGDWAYENNGVTTPDGYAVIDGGGDIAVDNSILTGLLFGIDGDGDPYVEVP